MRHYSPNNSVTSSGRRMITVQKVTWLSFHLGTDGVSMLCYSSVYNLYMLLNRFIIAVAGCSLG